MECRECREFPVLPLPYGYDQLEPYLDEETLQIHHDVLYRRYVENLNDIIEKYPAYCGYTMEELILNVEMLPPEIQVSVFQQAGGAYNHQIYFETMAPAPNAEPSRGALADAITQRFGSFAAFKAQFKEKALDVFGSGYAWLAINAMGELEIVATANQTTVLTLNMYPVIGIDVWEHAYFCQYPADRGSYIDSWFVVANWAMAELRFQG